MSFQPPRAEQELLLLCARPHADEQATERIKTLAAGNLNWTDVLQEARRWRVTLLLHRRLLLVCPELIPSQTRAKLDAYARAAAGRGMQLLGGLIEVGRAFQAAGVTAVPFKGPSLAAQMYGNLALRECSDLDILVHEQDMDRAGELLRRHGFIGHSHPDYAAQYIRESDHLAVELHWQAVGFSEDWQTVSKHFALPLDLPYFQGRLQETSLAGAPITALAPEDLLHVLCMHGSKHHWKLLIWTCDVAFLLHTHPELDVQHALAEAERLGSARMLALGLLLAHELLGTPLPSSVIAWIHTRPEVERLAALACRRLFVPGASEATFWSELNFFCRLWDRPRDRLRFAGHYGYCYTRALLARESHKALPRLV